MYEKGDNIAAFLYIIAVDQKDGASVFNRLKQEDLEIWLTDYSLGDLWKRSIITEGQP